MSQIDELTPADDAWLDAHAGRAAAELRDRSARIDVPGADSESAAPAAQRPARWSLAVAAAMVLALAGTFVVVNQRDPDPVRSGPEQLDPDEPVRFVPTVWPAELTGGTRAADGPAGTAEPMSEQHLLARDGVPSVLAVFSPGGAASIDRVITTLPEGSSPDLAGLFVLDGRDAMWQESSGAATLVVRIGDEDAAWLSSYAASRPELEALSLAFDGSTGDLDPSALPAGWSAEPATSGIASLAFGRVDTPIAASVGRLSSPYSREVRALVVATLRVDDAAAELARIAALLGPSGQTIALPNVGSGVLYSAHMGPTHLVASPMPGYLVYVDATGIDREELLSSVGSLVAVQGDDWAELVRSSPVPDDGTEAMERIAHGELNGLSWVLLATGEDVPYVLAMFDEGSDTSYSFSVDGLAEGTFRRGQAYLGGQPNGDHLFVVAPGGLVDSTLVVGGDPVETASAELADGRVLVFGFVDPGLLGEPMRPVQEEVRVTGTVIDAPYDSGPLSEG